MIPYEVTLFIIENVVIALILYVKIGYIIYDPIKELRKIYNFILWFYNTGSLSVAGRILEERTLREILKGCKENIIIKTPLNSKYYTLYIPSIKEISHLELEEMTSKFKKIYSLYSQKIEIYSIIITASLIFPSLFLLTLTIIIDFHVIYLVPILQVAVFYLITVKMKWMKRR